MITSASYAYTVKGGDTMTKIAAKADMTVKQLWALNPFIKNPNTIFIGENINTSSTTATTTAIVTIKSGNKIATTTKPVIKTPPVVVIATTTNSVPPVTTPVVLGSSEVKLTAYLTGYAWPDNTPPGSAISNPVIHHEAGGTGTYADPITVAVGHSFIGGVDVLDYKAGTKFYVPNLRKYFIAEDTCGDGNTPQNGPCHNLNKPGNSAPAGAQVWLDLWVGGVGSSQSSVLVCEDAITDLHTVIVNPVSNYAVNPGAIYINSCATQYGDTIVKQ